MSDVAPPSPSSRVLTALLAVLAAVALVMTAVVVSTTVAPSRSSAVAAEPIADSGAGARGVGVSGIGKVTGTPDTLRLSLGVDARRPDVGEALAEVAGTVEKVRAELRRRGVPPADVQTASVSVSPDSRQVKDEPPRIVGYAASQSLAVRLRNLTSAGATITAAVAAGGNAARLAGVSFSLEDNAALLERARDAAWADARAKAEQYARLSGRPLGAVVSVEERVDDGGHRTVSFALSAAQASVPIDPGSTQVSVTVDVNWALG